jgi:hypothetical protein
VEQKVAKNVTALDLNVTEYQDYHLLVYDAMWAVGYSQTVQKNLLSICPKSGAGMFLCNIFICLPKCLASHSKKQ